MKPKALGLLKEFPLWIPRRRRFPEGASSAGTRAAMLAAVSETAALQIRDNLSITSP